MTARIAYLSALASGGGRAMLQPPRPLFAPASFRDPERVFLPEHLTEHEAAASAHAPAGHEDTELPSQPRRGQRQFGQPQLRQAQPSEQNLGATERAIAQAEPAPLPVLPGTAVSPPGTAVNPPGQFGWSAAGSGQRASGDPLALGPQAMADPRIGPGWRAPQTGGPLTHLSHVRGPASMATDVPQTSGIAADSGRRAAADPAPAVPYYPAQKNPVSASPAPASARLGATPDEDRASRIPQSHRGQYAAELPRPVPLAAESVGPLPAAADAAPRLVAAPIAERPARTVGSTLSIGTIEVTLLAPPRDQSAASTFRREPRQPPPRLSRGIGARFGHGQT